MQASGSGSGELAEQRPHRSPVLFTAAQCFLLVAVTFLTFRPILRNGFIDWDDRDLVADNPDFVAPHPILIAHYWTKPFGGLYVPLTYTAWGLIASAARPSGGTAELDAGAFHAASLGVHILASTLVFFLVRRF